jgi:hypothetical protein
MLVLYNVHNDPEHHTSTVKTLLGDSKNYYSSPHTIGALLAFCQEQQETNSVFLLQTTYGMHVG